MELQPGVLRVLSSCSTPAAPHTGSRGPPFSVTLVDLPEKSHTLFWGMPHKKWHPSSQSVYHGTLGCHKELIQALRDISNCQGRLGWSASVGHTKYKVKAVECQLRS